MDLLKQLASDHREIKSLLNRLEITSERAAKTREKVFARLRGLLNAHAIAEEDVLYRRLQEEEKAKDEALEGKQEHHVVKFLLAELSALPKSDEDWGPKLTVMKELLEHHIKEEEDQMFKLTRKLIDREELARMADEFHAQKNDILEGVTLPTRIVRKVARRVAS